MEESRFCRLCLTTSSIYYSLLKNNGKEMLSTLTGTELSTDYLWSTESCVKCWLDLKLAYHIQQNFVEAEKKLQLTRLHEVASNLSETISIKEEVIERTVKKSESFSDDPDASQENDHDVEYPEVIFIETEEIQDLEAESPCICPICGQTFPNESSLYVHVKEHYSEKQFCDDCKLNLTDITAYREHLESKHPALLKKTFFCGICQLSFQYKTLYQVHLDAVHPSVIVKNKRKKNSEEGFDMSGTNLQCEECSKVLPNKNAYKVHVKGHSRKPCPVCGAQITIYNLSKHVALHQSTPQVCHLCGITAKNFESLRGHMYYTHSKKKLTCEECGKEFKKLYTYKMHIKKEHTGERSFTCDTCGKRFFAKYDLMTHIKSTHLKERPYICQYCKRGFSSRFAMRTHERQHTNEAPYVCEVCGEGFRQNVSLRAHRKSKHNIIEKKVTECKVCGKMFINDWALKSHMRLVHD